MSAYANVHVVNNEGCLSLTPTSAQPSTHYFHFMAPLKSHTMALTHCPAVSRKYLIPSYGTVITKTFAHISPQNNDVQPPIII